MTVQQHTLSNGFRIVTEQMPGLKSASIGIWVTAGGRHERADQNGIAHFLEHMAFKGTERRSALQIAEAIEDVGGYINAYTSREMTAYYARVLENDVPLALDVIADILLNPVFEQSEIEVERGVILQEIGQAHDTPDDVIFDWLQEEAYPDQALGRTILGMSDRVKTFGKADLSDFIGEHYGPDQMILSAAGAVNPDELLALAEKLFGHLPPRSQPQAASRRRLNLRRSQAESGALKRSWNRRISRWHLKVLTTATRASTRHKSTRSPWAAGCRRGCFRNCARIAGCATRSLRRPVPMPIPE